MFNKDGRTGDISSDSHKGNSFYARKYSKERHGYSFINELLRFIEVGKLSGHDFKGSERDLQNLLKRMGEMCVDK